MFCVSDQATLERGIAEEELDRIVLLKSKIQSDGAVSRMDAGGIFASCEAQGVESSPAVISCEVRT